MITAGKKHCRRRLFLLICIYRSRRRMAVPSLHCTILLYQILNFTYQNHFLRGSRNGSKNKPTFRECALFWPCSCRFKSRLNPTMTAAVLSCLVLSGLVLSCIVLSCISSSFFASYSGSLFPIYIGECLHFCCFCFPMLPFLCLVVVSMQLLSAAMSFRDVVWC